jgi:hypothetical protein
MISISPSKALVEALSAAGKPVEMKISLRENGGHRRRRDDPRWRGSRPAVARRFPRKPESSR